jgi:hypothetical protein
MTDAGVGMVDRRRSLKLRWMASDSEADMANEWLFQLRLNVSAERSAALREDPACTSYAPLRDVLRRYDATLKCQYDAFADYVSEAEQSDPDNYPLYQWTKETIEKPEKKAKFLQSFTLYVDGQEVYRKEVVDSLHEALSALVGHDGIESVVRYDTNPASNPQPPR